MFRILPSLYDGEVHIPWYSVAVFYSVELLIAVSLYGMTTVKSMSSIGYISEEMLVPVIATIIVTAFIMYVVFYLVSFQDRKSKVLANKVEALEAGKSVDSVAIASIENFHTIYIVAMALGIIVTSAISFVLMAAVIGNYVNISTTLYACTYSAVATVIVFALFDYFCGRRIADGTFKAKVIAPLEKAIAAKFETVVEETAAPESEADDKVKLIAQLLSEISKKE